MRWVSTRVLPEPAPARIEQRPVAVRDGLALGLVEAVEQLLRGARRAGSRPSSLEDRARRGGRARGCQRERTRPTLPPMGLCRRRPSQLRGRSRAHARWVTHRPSDAVGADRAAGRRRPLDPERHYLEGAPERRRRLHADARRDQLRLGLVPDAAQAHAAGCGPATTRSPGRWPTTSARAGPWTQRRAAGDAHRGDRRRCSASAPTTS